MSRILLIGAGNVASALGPALYRAGHTITGIYSRTLASAQALSDRIPGHTPVTNDTDQLAPLVSDSDVVLISLTDDATRRMVGLLTPDPDVIWLHTAGSIGIGLLSRLGPDYGSFYPLQTFTKGVELNLREVPFFIEGSNPQTTERIRLLAESLSDNVKDADSELRERMHVAAVFACNFMTYLHSIAADILEQSGLTIDLLKPLIAQTIDKMGRIGPHAAQTGPARRGDTEVCRAHLQTLAGAPAEIYRMLTNSIMERYGHETERL